METHIKVIFALIVVFGAGLLAINYFVLGQL